MGRLLFPSFLDLVGRRVLVVGGGPVAASKVRPLLDAGAHVVVVAPEVVDAIAREPVEIHRRTFDAADLEDVWYVVTAAPPPTNAHVVREATRRRIFVNAVDDPAHATAFAGSSFQRGPVTVALSTGGEAPALARVLREALERLIGRDVHDWTALAARLRLDWRREDVPMGKRRNALLAALAQEYRESRRAPAARDADARRTSRGPAGRAASGLVSLIGAGPGDPELLTRRAARRLAEADLVLYDALVSPAAVSLARHAQQIFVGRRRGTSTLGQDAIIRTLIRAARRGRRVVRLKGGDPFVFGRGGEEALALADAGIPFEIVPGVSSAFAAPAAAFIPVTHRGLSSGVVVTTGHDLERFASLVGWIPPGAATLVVLMGIERRGEIAEALAESGWRAATPVAIVRDASLPEQAVWTGTLGSLARAPDADAPGTIVVGEVVRLRDALAREPRAVTAEVRHG